MKKEHEKKRVKTAAVQIFTEKGKEEKNLTKILNAINEAAANGAELIVFPEGVNNGYIFDSPEEAHRMATPVPGPFTGALCRKAKEKGVYLGIGILERGPEFNVYNDSLLIDTLGNIAGKYQKNFFIKADKHWFKYGNLGFPVFQTSFGKVGFFICADGRLPESTRALALNGAEVLLNTSNWGGPDQYSVHVPTRAVENHCWVVAADKIKEEPGNKYWGNSFIMNPEGEYLARASETEEEIIYAEIEPWRASDKKLGKYNNFITDRRPELYYLIKEKYNETPVAKVLEELVIPEKMNVQLSIVQISNDGEEPESTLKKALAECKEVNHKFFGDFIVLPELFLFQRSKIKDNLKVYTELSLEALSKFSELARELKVHFVLNIIEKDLDKYYSTAYFIGPRGEIGKYRKVHLWSEEKEWATAGDYFPIFKTDFGYIGIMLGYDGNFPETARCLMLGGADLICWPCDWQAEYEFNFIASERALENKIFIAAANRLDSICKGPSLLIQPLGYPITVLKAEIPYGKQGWISRLFNLSNSRSKKIVQNTCLLKHRRPEIYGVITEKR